MSPAERFTRESKMRKDTMTINSHCCECENNSKISQSIRLFLFLELETSRDRSTQNISTVQHLTGQGSLLQIQSGALALSKLPVVQSDNIHAISTNTDNGAGTTEAVDLVSNTEHFCDLFVVGKSFGLGLAGNSWPEN